MKHAYIVSTDNLPHPVPETNLLVTELKALEVTGEIVSWQAQDVDWTATDMVLVRTPWDYIYKLEAFLAWLDTTAEAAPVYNAPDIIKWNIHKHYLVDLLQRGVDVIPTQYVSQGQHVHLADLDLLRDAPGLVIKPAVSVGAIGTGYFKTVSDAAQAHLDSLLQKDDALIQPFVPAIQTRGETSLVYFAGVFSHGVIKVPAVGDYRIHKEYGGTYTPYEPTNAEKALAEQSLAAVGEALSYARIDMVLTDTGPLLMEMELIEPELYFPYADGSAQRFAQVIAEIINAAG